MCYLQHPPDAPFPPAPPPPCLVLAPVTEIDLPWGRLPPLEGSMAILFLLTNRYISEVQGAVMIRVTLGKRLGVEFFNVKLIREKDFFFFFYVKRICVLQVGKSSFSCLHSAIVVR